MSLQKLGDNARRPAAMLAYSKFWYYVRGMQNRSTSFPEGAGHQAAGPGLPGLVSAEPAEVAVAVLMGMGWRGEIGGTRWSTVHRA